MSGGSLSPEGFAEDMKEARERFDVVQSNDVTVLVDLDNPEARAQFERVLPKVSQHFGVAKVERWASKSGNTHVAVTLLKPQPIGVRIALQAALGSDGAREVLALCRMANGCVEPSVLFRPRAAEVMPWEW